MITNRKVQFGPFASGERSHQSLRAVMMPTMKRGILVLSCSCVALAFACTPDEPGTEDEIGDTAGESSTTDDTTGTDTTTTDTTDTTETDTGAPDLATVSGVIVDMQGAPLPSPGVQLCGPIDDMGIVEACIPVPVDAGSFTVGAKKLGLWSLKVVHGPVDGRNFAGHAFRITLNDGDALDFSSPPITVPEVSTLTPLAGETMVSVEGGLTITIDPANAQTPDFIAPTQLGGLVVPQEFWRVTEVDGQPVMHAWAFSPFGTKAKSGSFTFTIDDALGLAAGETVNVHAIEKDNGDIHLVATGIVNGDASAIDLTPEGEGLHELTWLMITQ